MGISKFKHASAMEIREELMALRELIELKLNFFTPVNDITSSDGVRAMLEGMARLEDVELKMKGADLIHSINRVKKTVTNELKFVRPWRVVCKEFRQKVDAGEFAAIGEGVPLSWLYDNFGCTRGDAASEDLPLHARIGFGPNRRRAGTEEQVLLSDAFLFLKTASTLFELLRTETEKEKMKGTTFEKAPKRLRNLTLSVCANARISLFTFCSFVECFVNGVGLDYILRNPSLPPDSAQTLRGFKANGSYLSLELKLEKFPGIISSRIGPQIVVTDPKQIREPFKTFFSVAKPTRDSIAHHADGKARIWLSPHEWMSLSEATARGTIQCCREFWTACYPGREYPRYLERLDYDTLSSIAGDLVERV